MSISAVKPHKLYVEEIYVETCKKWYVKCKKLIIFLVLNYSLMVAKHGCRLLLIGLRWDAICKIIFCIPFLILAVECTFSLWSLTLCMSCKY